MVPSSQFGLMNFCVCQRAVPSCVVHAGLSPAGTPVFIAEDIFVDEWYQSVYSDSEYGEALNIPSFLF